MRVIIFPQKDHLQWQLNHQARPDEQGERKDFYLKQIMANGNLGFEKIKQQ